MRIGWQFAWVLIGLGGSLTLALCAYRLFVQFKDVGYLPDGMKAIPSFWRIVLFPSDPPFLRSTAEALRRRLRNFRVGCMILAIWVLLGAIIFRAWEN